MNDRYIIKVINNNGQAVELPYLFMTPLSALQYAIRSGLKSGTFIVTPPSTFNRGIEPWS